MQCACLPLTSNLVYVSRETFNASSRLRKKIETGANDVGRLRVDEEIAAGRPRVAAGTKVNVLDIIVYPNEALVDSIDTALTDLLGARTREAIYDGLARELSLAREDVPSHLNEFRETLQKTFGEAASTIESFIARRLYATLGWQFIDVAGFGLNEHFDLVKGIADRAKKMSSD